MTVFPRPNGTAPTTRLSELTPLNARFVHYLRLWEEGETGVSRIGEELTGHLGPAKGERVAEIWCALCDLLAQYGHRPLEIMPAGSTGITGDEAGFAQLVALAAETRREDAMFAALMMVRPDITPIVISLATQAGLSIRQSDLCAQARPRPASHHGTARLH